MLGDHGSRAGLTRPSYSREQHVLFVPTPGQYRLIERRGAVPAPGETVKLSGGARFRVLRVGPSPLPETDIACAYLEALDR